MITLCKTFNNMPVTEFMIKDNENTIYAKKESINQLKTK